MFNAAGAGSLLLANQPEEASAFWSNAKSLSSYPTLASDIAETQRRISRKTAPGTLPEPVRSQ